MSDLHVLQYDSTLLLQDSAWVLNGQSGSSPDVSHPNGHPSYTCLTGFVVLLELNEVEMRETPNVSIRIIQVKNQ